MSGGYGVSPDDVNTVWFKVDGPGTVDFGDKNVVKTWARFSEPGTYVLGLEAVDELISESNEVQITARPGNRLGGGELHTLIVLEDKTVVGCGRSNKGQFGIN